MSEFIVEKGYASSTVVFVIRAIHACSNVPWYSQYRVTGSGYWVGSGLATTVCSSQVVRMNVGAVLMAA